MMRSDRRRDVLLLDVDMCYCLSFIECVGFRTLRMQRHRWNPLGLRIESGSVLFWVDSFTVILLFFDDMILIL
jgi:hypothetical protein